MWIRKSANKVILKQLLLGVKQDVKIYVKLKFVKRVKNRM